MRRIVLPVIAAALLAACGGPTDDRAASVTTAPPAVTDAPAGTSPGTRQSGTGVTEVPEALKFAAPLVGGGNIELTTLAGRPVLLWFWAPW